MNRLTILLIFAFAVCVFGSPASADDIDESITSLDRFQLWSKCEPFGLVVEDLSDDAAKIGLTKEAVLTAVRSRLRAARLYSEQPSRNSLYVNIGVIGPAFDVDIAYNKWVKDDISDEYARIATWSISSIGTYSRDSSFILSAVSRGMDRFIDEYLRVNASACKP